jgi:hypothetical protein
MERISHLQLLCIFEVPRKQDDASNMIIVDQGFDFGAWGEAVESHRKELRLSVRYKSVGEFD